MESKNGCFGRLMASFPVQDQCEFLVVYSSSNNQGSSNTDEMPIYLGGVVYFALDQWNVYPPESPLPLEVPS